MNYYIDFDNTLYNTPKLIDKMLNTIVYSIKKEENINEEKLFTECKSMFNRDNIYNIYELAKYFSNKYNTSLTSMIKDINLAILDSKDCVFEDTIPFLKRLKSKENNIYILTYCKESLQYQSLKISGSQIADFFDAIYITSVPKYNLDIDYFNGIFIDDNPNDLLGLYSKTPKEVIRLRRDGNKYSIKDIENSNIKEYKNLEEIPIN